MTRLLQDEARNALRRLVKASNLDERLLADLLGMPTATLVGYLSGDMAIPSRVLLEMQQIVQQMDAGQLRDVSEIDI